MSRRILFFGDASSIHMQRWVAAMAQRGFDCVLATRRPAQVPGASDVIAVQPGADALGWFSALPEVRRLAARLRPQWLHGHYVTSYGLWAAACRAVVDAPLVQTAWGSDILVTPRAPGLNGRLMAHLVRRSLRPAALLTADSHDTLAQMARFLAAGSPARLEEVLWGVDTAHFVPGTPAPGFELVSLRNWEPNYQIHTVLEAFALLAAKLVAQGSSTAPVLHLLGGGPDEAALRARAQQLGLGVVGGAQLHFTGRVNAQQMLQTMQRCRASISVPRSDATSVSVLESMACALPVLASDLPANRQWLHADMLVPVQDAATLAAKLLHLHDAPETAQAQGQRNRQTVLHGASQQVQMDRMAALYHALLEQPAKAAA